MTLLGPYESYLSAPSPRRSIPKEITLTGQNDILQQQLLESWRLSEPTLARTKLVRELTKQLTTIFNHRRPGDQRFLVEVFGSVSWGGETGGGGDIDLVVLDTQLRRGYIPELWRLPPGEVGQGPTHNTKVPGIYNVYLVQEILKGQGMTNIRPVARANCPIVKFVPSSLGGVECDINVNDLGGWYNSKLFLAYCNISPFVLRPMIYGLKRWLKEWGLNDPSGVKGGHASMSSYCVTLMAIAYLQHVGVLPNLQAGVPIPAVHDRTDSSMSEVVWTSWGKAQGDVQHVWFETSPPPGWKNKHPDLTAAQAIFGFFQYFTKGSPNSFNYLTHFVSIVNGGIMERGSPQNSLATRRQEYRELLMSSNYTQREIQEFMTVYDARIDAEELKMGCGGYGITPRRWDQSRLVVQDPFLWSKNCAGAMAKKSLDRFIRAMQLSSELLRDPRTSFNELLALPEQHPPGPTTAKSRRGSRKPNRMKAAAQKGRAAGAQ